MNSNTGGKGFLRIWATTAGQSLPVQGVPVRILDGDGKLLHVLRTGEGGLTATVELTTPPAAESLAPGSSQKPYTAYTVTAEMTGFQPVRDLTVPVFDGITSVQPLVLIPASSQGPAGNTSPILVYPEEMYANLTRGGGTAENPLPETEPQYPLRPRNTPEGDRSYLDDIDILDMEGNL